MFVFELRAIKGSCSCIPAAGTKLYGDVTDTCVLIPDRYACITHKLLMEQFYREMYYLYTNMRWDMVDVTQQHNSIQKASCGVRYLGFVLSHEATIYSRLFLVYRNVINMFIVYIRRVIHSYDLYLGGLFLFIYFR